MKTTPLIAAAATVALVGAAAVPASAQTFTQTKRVFLADQFFAGVDGAPNSPFGTAVGGVAFDGTTAYVGGFNGSGADSSVGVVAVSGLNSGPFATAAVTPLAGSTFTAPSNRGINSVAYDPVSASPVIAFDSGTASTSFIRSVNPATGTANYTTTNPGGQRPFAVAFDPGAGDTPTPNDGFFASGQGRRAGLDPITGAEIFSFSGGPATPGLIFTSTPSIGFANRGADFDSEGNLAVATNSGVSYGIRTGQNSIVGLDNMSAGTTGSILSAGANNIGRDVAILEGAGLDGVDLLAVALRDSTAANASDGTSFAVTDTNVYITELDGSLVATLTGAESGLAQAFANDTKQLAYALSPDGVPTLVIADFVERRLDVYTITPIPEPTALAAVGLGGLALLRRRRA